MNEFEEPNANNLSFYIAYHQLSVKSFGAILQDIGKLGDEIAMSYLSSKGTEYDKLDSIVLDYIKTGDSIKFTLGEGWIPTITTDDNNDIVISTPRKIGIPLLVGYLLLTSVQRYQDIKNKHLDNKLKQIEIQLKESELKKLTELNENTYHYQRESDKIVKQIITNQDFTIIQIFDIDIRNSEGRKEHEE